jgi:hypothetical protein
MSIVKIVDRHRRRFVVQKSKEAVRPSSVFSDDYSTHSPRARGVLKIGSMTTDSTKLGYYLECSCHAFLSDLEFSI